jgi:hypothetical protein
VPVTPQATGRNAIAETRVLSISSNASARAAAQSRQGGGLRTAMARCDHLKLRLLRLFSLSARARPYESISTSIPIANKAEVTATIIETITVYVRHHVACWYLSYLVLPDLFVKQNNLSLLVDGICYRFVIIPFITHLNISSYSLIGNQ